MNNVVNEQPLGTLIIEVVSVNGLSRKMDAFVAVHVGPVVYKTPHVDNNADPEFNKQFTFHPAGSFFDTGYLMVKVYNYSLFVSNELVGEAAVPYRQLRQGLNTLSLSAPSNTPRSSFIVRSASAAPTAAPTLHSAATPPRASLDRQSLDGGDPPSAVGVVKVKVRTELPSGYLPSASPVTTAKRSLKLIPRALLGEGLRASPASPAPETSTCAAREEKGAVGDVGASKNKRRRAGATPPGLSRGFLGVLGLALGVVFSIRCRRLNSRSKREEYVVVKKGEWLTQIAKRKIGTNSQVTIEEICKTNNISDRNKLVPGQRVKLR